jgi:ethanolamine-phosphate cytidylyltransferase
MADTLVVGVISSEAIGKAKGPPIMSDKERVALVKSCKWVDEIVEGVAYDPTIELLDKLNCSHVAHGDDLV